MPVMSNILQSCSQEQLARKSFYFHKKLKGKEWPAKIFFEQFSAWKYVLLYRHTVKNCNAPRRTVRRYWFLATKFSACPIRAGTIFCWQNKTDRGQLFPGNYGRPSGILSRAREQSGVLNETYAAQVIGPTRWGEITAERTT